ncbi:MAG: DUF2232 domain-containing protein [Candidatus Nucleicultricaceae bacterium]
MQTHFLKNETLLIVGGGTLSALFYYLQATSSFFGVFVMLPLALLGLSQGYRKMALGGILGAFVVALLAAKPTYALLYLLTNAGPATVFIRYLLLSRGDAKKIEWYPLGQALSALVMYGLLFCAIHEHFLAPTLKIEIETVLKHIEAQTTGPQQQMFVEAFRLLEQLTSGMSTISITVWTLLSCYISERLLMKGNHNIRPMPVINQLTLPWWLWIAFAMAGTLAFLLNNAPAALSLNIFVFLGFIFFLHGLSIVHYCLNRSKNPRLFLLLFYGSVLLLGWIIVSLVVLLGLFEPWVNCRENLSKKLGN